METSEKEAEPEPSGEQPEQNNNPPNQKRKHHCSGESMETLETEAEPADQQPAQNGNPPKRKKKKRKQVLPTVELDTSLLPSLSEALKDDTDPIIGLQYILEYRSPSKTVQPHYQCKLCCFNSTQHEMDQHVKGWKHAIKYLTKHHPDKITFDVKEIDDVRISETKKAVKTAAAEVEKAEGRGETKVILKEPYEVPEFKSSSSALPSIARIGAILDASLLRPLSEMLEDITETIIGLQYIWEYRSPTQTVQSHYQCKLCNFNSVQADMIGHLKGRKHIFRYLLKHQPDEFPYEEKAIKSYEVKRAVRIASAEVEKTHGRGKIKVVLMEPYQVSEFKEFHTAFPKTRPPPPPKAQRKGPKGPPLHSALPKITPPPDQGMGPTGPPLASRFHDSRFRGTFLPHGGRSSDFPSGKYTESGYGRHMSTPAFPDRGNAPGPISDSIGPRRNGFGRGGPMVQGPNTVYPKDYQHNFRDRPAIQPNDRPGILGPSPQSNNLQALLKHLETFQIENENDAQLVLKVTKNLTDALMEYRLRNIPAASTFVNPSMMPTNLFNAPARLQGNRYSSNPFGPSSYPDGPQRYFN